MVIDNRGFVLDADINSLIKFGDLIHDRLSKPIAIVNGKGKQFIISLQQPCQINQVVLKEKIHLGHRVWKYNISFREKNGNWKLLTDGSAIGHKQIHQFKKITTDQLKLEIIESKGEPVIELFAV